MSDEPEQQQPDRIVKVPRGRRFWLERALRRPEPVEDQEPEVPTDE